MFDIGHRKPVDDSKPDIILDHLLPCEFTEPCTIVTTRANRLMTEMHTAKHRMPAAAPVSKRVNTPKNNDAELITFVLVA